MERIHGIRVFELRMESNIPVYDPRSYERFFKWRREWPVKFRLLMKSCNKGLDCELVKYLLMQGLSDGYLLKTKWKNSSQQCHFQCFDSGGPRHVTNRGPIFSVNLFIYLASPV